MPAEMKEMEEFKKLPRKQASFNQTKHKVTEYSEIHSAVLYSLEFIHVICRMCSLVTYPSVRPRREFRLSWQNVKLLDWKGDAKIHTNLAEGSL